MTQDPADGTFDGSYSDVADEQLDVLEDGPEPDLHNAALDACQLVFDATSIAQSRSSVIQTSDGMRFRLALAGHSPYKVFWSKTDDGPRVEAIFPHP